MSSGFAMTRQKKTTYVMLTPERRFQIEEQIRTRRAARVAAGLPPDSPEPEHEEEEEEEPEEEQHPVSMKEEEEFPSPPRFNMKDAEAKFAVTQADKMTEQQYILESIQDEAYVEANQRFIRQERTATNAFFAELDVKGEAEQPEEPHEPELRLLSLYVEPVMKIVDISSED